MSLDWESLFDNFGIKPVSSTDKTKSAYVPNKGQRDAIEAAGFLPAPDGQTPSPLIQLKVLFDPVFNEVTTRYYLSTRSAAAARLPEPRMGRELISAWLELGDEVLIGNIGTSIYALKLGHLPDELAVMEEIARNSPPDRVISRAARAGGPAPTRGVTRTEFIRDPYVVAAALLRADGRCEQPGCTRELFLRQDRTPYLEVHHLVPLSAAGPDTLHNVAALCPSCHRELHYGTDREQLTHQLRTFVAALPSLRANV